MDSQRSTFLLFRKYRRRYFLHNKKIALLLLIFYLQISAENDSPVILHYIVSPMFLEETNSSAVYTLKLSLFSSFALTFSVQRYPLCLTTAALWLLCRRCNSFPAALPMRFPRFFPRCSVEAFSLLSCSGCSLAAPGGSIAQNGCRLCGSLKNDTTFSYKNIVRF